MHLDGAAFEDLTYWVSFGEADSDGRQALQLHALAGADAREAALDLSAWLPENAQNSFANTSVESIVLEVSHQCDTDFTAVPSGLKPSVVAQLRASEFPYVKPV